MEGFIIINVRAHLLPPMPHVLLLLLLPILVLSLPQCLPFLAGSLNPVNGTLL